jgi:hypothetical protein
MVDRSELAKAFEEADEYERELDRKDLEEDIIRTDLLAEHVAEGVGVKDVRDEEDPS